MEDRELIRLIQNGQTQYLNEIARRYYDDIYYFCCYQTGRREESYDLAQETFLKFIKYVDHYRYRNLKGYLLTIAMNLCREYMRSSMQTQTRTVPGADPFKKAGTEDTANPALADHTKIMEDSMLLAQALMKLPESQREAVLLHHFYGYKNREIARMTGVSYDAVKSRIRQGLSKLGELLDQNDFK